MIRRLLSFILLIIIGYLVYKAFYGTDEEKEHVSQIREKSFDLGRELWEIGSEIGREVMNFVRSERNEQTVDELNTSLDSFNHFLESWSADLPEDKRQELHDALKRLELDSEKLRHEMKDSTNAADESIRNWRGELADLLDRLRQLMEQKQYND